MVIEDIGRGRRSGLWEADSWLIYLPATDKITLVTDWDRDETKADRYSLDYKYV